MRPLIVLVCIFAAVMTAPANIKREYEVYDLEKAPELFEKFIIDYDRNYKDEADRQAHYEAFVKNLEIINKLNAESDSATFGINLFADRIEEEGGQGCVILPPDALDD